VNPVAEEANITAAGTTAEVSPPSTPSPASPASGETTAPSVNCAP
jgi:hypothetical protein